MENLAQVLAEPLAEDLGRKQKRRWFSPLLGLAVGAAFIGAIVAHVDLHSVGMVLANAEPLWLLAAIVCALGGLTIRGFRWWLMLSTTGSNVSFTNSLRIFLGSFSLNNVMPLRLGDVVRAFGFTEELGCSPWSVIGTLVTERTLDLLILIGLSAVVIHVLPSGALPPRLGVALEIVVAVVLASMVGLFLFNRTLRGLLDSAACRNAARRFAPAEFARARCTDILAATANCCSLRVLPLLVTLSIAGWMCEGIVFIIVLCALGLPANPAAALLGFGSGTLGTMLPGPPGNFGTYDFLAIQGLVAGGISTSAATAITLLAHLTIWAPVTIIGSALLLLVPMERRRRISQLRSASFTDG
jgi:uncharacterized protein (TIRG00374 family)